MAWPTLLREVFADVTSNCFMEISNFFFIFWLGHLQRDLEFIWVTSFVFWVSDGMADSAARGFRRWADVMRAVGCPRRRGYFVAIALWDSEFFRCLVVGTSSERFGIYMGNFHFSFGCNGLVWQCGRKGLMCRCRLEARDDAVLSQRFRNFFVYLLVGTCL